MKWWYKVAANCAPPPAQVTLKHITEERVTLYHQVPPLGENIPIYIEPFQVGYLVPMEDKI